MNTTSSSAAPVHVIGGGLAGSEAAWQIAQSGVPVILHEMRRDEPTSSSEAIGEAKSSDSQAAGRKIRTDAHQTDGLADEPRAGVEHVDGLGYHSLRRKFATELKGIPLKDLCQLGGWKDPRWTDIPRPGARPMTFLTPNIVTKD